VNDGFQAHGGIGALPAGSEGASAPLTISVALCTRNGSQFVGEQVASILAQSLLPDEIVLSDDASTDSTVAQVLGAVATSNDLVGNSVLDLKLLRNSEPLGVVQNFVQAMDACSSDLIILCDQDDRWDTSRLERIRREFESRPSLRLLHGNARLINSVGAPLGRSLSDVQKISSWERDRLAMGEGFQVLIRRNVVTGATVAVRRSLLDLARPFPADWLHDEWLGVIASALDSLGFLDESLVDYRQHGGNQIGVHERDLREKLGMLFADGDERNHRMESRAQSLARQLKRLGPQVPERYKAMAFDKLAHELARQAFPTNRLLRAFRVAQEAHSGRYSNFARGRKDILLDLVQPRTRERTGTRGLVGDPRR
jgi:glycosyltransferase involved in cell wall biosynthesis